MKRFRALGIGISGLAIALVCSGPALAKKTVIPDEEMDQVTAAGQPKSAQAKSVYGPAEAYNDQFNLIAPVIDGQNGLTALTLNNIFGENQISNGVNIQAGNSNEGQQINDFIQSWGSAKAHDAVVVEGKRGGDGGDGGRANSSGLISKSNAGNGGNGGNAAPGKIALLWEFADEISSAESKYGSATSFNHVYTNIATVFEENAQSNLTALVVNNISGFNQVANGLNISSSAISAGGDSINAGGSVATGQANVIRQFRGAPYKWWEAPTFSDR